MYTEYSKVNTECELFRNGQCCMHLYTPGICYSDVLTHVTREQIAARTSEGLVTKTSHSDGGDDVFI